MCSKYIGFIIKLKHDKSLQLDDIRLKLKHLNFRSI